MSVTSDATGAMETAGSLWREAGLESSALQRLQLTGEQPLLPTSFHVGVAAQSTIACAALAATELGRTRGGDAASVQVDMHAAERECTGLFELNGERPTAWAPLSGLYPCRDGYVRIHANFTHHRDNALTVLGLDPARADRQEVTANLETWDKVHFESEATANGAVVAACRSFDEWDRTEQATVLAQGPLFTLERIGDAPARALPAPDERSKPLAGVRVLDLTRILAGPVCGRTLAAYGADVMLVNAPHLPNIEAIVDTSRGKRACHVDLEASAGQAQLGELLQGAHVFVQGYRPGAIAAKGFSPENVAQQFPGCVYVSLSAYGDRGPWAPRRGFDSLVQTATGFNIAEAEAAGDEIPRPMPVQILDYASGFLMAFATEVALLRQQTEGGTWHVRVGLAQTAQWLRGLGRIDDGFRRDKPELKDYLQSFPCQQGDLRAMPHAARMDGAQCASVRPSVGPGSHEPIWP